MSPRTRPRRRAPQLLAITPPARREEAPDDSRFLTWLCRLADRGVDAVQIRHKERDDRFVYERLCAAVALGDSGRDRPLILVNGRIDLAIAAGADGVHLPSAGLPIRSLRDRFDRELILGLSTHDVAEVERAAAEGADFVTFGPVWDTPSKRRFGVPPGLDALTEACAVGLPVLGLGGVEPERLAILAESGAHGAAAIRAFLHPSSLVEMVRRARLAWPT